MMWIFVEELKFKLNKEWQAFVDWHIYPHFQEYKHQGLGKYAMNPLVKICNSLARNIGLFPCYFKKWPITIVSDGPFYNGQIMGAGLGYK